MKTITPFLWFDTQAEEAANFYASVFPNARVLGLSRYGEGGMRPAGLAMTVNFEINGQEFVALNGGPEFTFTEAISFMVPCESQAEVDDLWDKLTRDGGAPGPCGWLKDKFGVSWQIVPTVLFELMQDKDAEKAARVTQAMLKMSKIEIAGLRQAYEQA